MIKPTRKVNPRAFMHETQLSDQEGSKMLATVNVQKCARESH